VRNTGRSELTINLGFENLEGIGELSQSTLYLRAGEVKPIGLVLKGVNRPGITIGNLIAYSGIISEKIAIVVQIKERNALETNLDMNLKLLKNKFFQPGEEIPIKITLVSKGFEGNLNGTMRSQIIDLKNNVIYSDDEPISFDKTFSLEKNLILPDDVEKGKYLILQKLNMGNLSRESLESFDVGGKEVPIFRNLVILACILVFIILVKIIFWIVYKIEIWRIKRGLRKN
jgi:hypothetical protein